MLVSPRFFAGTFGLKTGNVTNHLLALENYSQLLRDFVLHVPTRASPPDPDAPLPLLLYFHGQYGTAAGSARNQAFGARGEAEGFMVAYLQGLDDAQGL